MNQKLIFGLNVSSIDRSHETGGTVEDIRILFVEDEDSVRAFAVRALKKKAMTSSAATRRKTLWNTSKKTPTSTS